jgi:predicted transposase YbfD/YdcC
VIGLCYSERKEGDSERTFQTRYFIGSKRAKTRYYGNALRERWHVENDLHWRLDVVFGEDDGRVAQRNAAANFATIRRLALNLVKQEDSRMSVAKKRYAASLDTDYLEKIINA